MNAGLKPGDCGAWVIDPNNHQILGHVVATDDFGEVYIMPIARTFRDMKQYFQAKIVDLALDCDIRAWRNAHGLDENRPSSKQQKL